MQLIHRFPKESVQLTTFVSFWNKPRFVRVAIKYKSLLCETTEVDMKIEEHNIEDELSHCEVVAIVFIKVSYRHRNLWASLNKGCVFSCQCLPHVSSAESSSSEKYFRLIAIAIKRYELDLALL